MGQNSEINFSGGFFCLFFNNSEALFCVDLPHLQLIQQVIFEQKSC